MFCALRMVFGCLGGGTERVIVDEGDSIERNLLQTYDEAKVIWTWTLALMSSNGFSAWHAEYGIFALSCGAGRNSN